MRMKRTTAIAISLALFGGIVIADAWARGGGGRRGGSRRSSRRTRDKNKDDKKKLDQARDRLVQKSHRDTDARRTRGGLD